LLWDFSWESTIGVDLVWSPPHTMTYLAMTLAGVGALLLISKRAENGAKGIALGKVEAPLGGWLLLWSAITFATAVLFDRWWQLAYGLGAGIWHPPQILKTVAFFAALLGLWLLARNAAAESGGRDERRREILCCVAVGLILALINIVTITSSYPNYQHGASFYKVACAIYPISLIALAASSHLRWPATAAATIYTLVIGVMTWLLPLIPAKPQVGPIYNALEHLMPPPFPLLLLVPALLIDLALIKIRWRGGTAISWLQAIVLGFVFFFSFILTQWSFAEFLLKPAANNWFFAGGGKHWPFFLKISPPARVMFWETLPGQPPDSLTGRGRLIALLLAIGAARIGLWLGAWLKRIRL